MNRQIKGLLYFFTADSRRSFLIFWGILLGSLVGTLLLTTGAYIFLNGVEVNMRFALSFAIYIYCAIFAFVTVKESIPFSIKMGATRKNFFISLGIFFIGLSVLKSILANTIHSIVLTITNQLLLFEFDFIHLAQLINDTWLTRVIIDATCMFFILSAMFGIGLLFYKYGLAGGGGFIALVIVFLLVGVAADFITEFFVNIVESFDLIFFYQLAAVGLLLYGLTWLLVRKVTIVKSR
ncbi:hypothetical protein LG329_14025 [Virgibacillus necropolis]|uniref:hypothetical protein n=1 Tax=Virgibacillus necropolis TaxID=163877 RepID=UPI0038501984